MAKCPFCIVECGRSWCPYNEPEEDTEAKVKRSDMRKIIFETLESGWSHPEANAKLAEDILVAIERAGMLPPIAFLPKLKISDNAWESEQDG
jgi:hypothetical protein